MFGTAVTFLKRTSQKYLFPQIDFYLHSSLPRDFAPFAAQQNGFALRSLE
jgi:hypothetical protein